ncbi:MFS transporter [Microvirga arabica]|uniref:MFS transporter n=1 Tax=Microvirga arabica TaxID=1128671 RepID=UPI00193AA660|nr:MFS transporter [Microvirga arabica]MBM1173480.1 MFS transporter [Microvirga arabica]
MATAAYARTLHHTHWGVVGVVVGAGIVTALQVGKAAIATPMLQSDMGLDLAAAGWLTGIFAVLGLVGGIPAGALVTAAGDRRMLILGLGAIVLGTVIGATAPGFPVLLASRVLEGFGFLLVTVAGPAILHRVVQSGQRDLAFALWSCFMPAGVALAMVAGPLFSDWRMLWWGNAGLAAAAIVAGLAIVPAATARVSVSWRSAASDSLRVLTSREPILLAACFASYSLMFFALFSFLPVLLMEQMAIAHGTAGLLSSVATGANIIGNLAAGYLLARGISRPALLAGAYLIMGLVSPGIFLPFFADTPTFLLCVLFSGIGGMIPATLISSAPLLAWSPALAPVVIGLVMQGSNLGQVIGPVAVGGATEAYSWVAAAGIVLIAGVIAAITALAIDFSDRRSR